MNDPILIVECPNETTAVLTLNRPGRRNALSMGLMEALCEALESLAGQPRRRVAILRGAGLVFCAGLDLDEAADLSTAEESTQRVARTLGAVGASPLITIAAVHGAAYAGGAALMACCDLAVAAKGTQICFPEVRRGLLPALAAAALRSHLCRGDLRELLLLGEPIDAHRALSMGLVRRVVPADRLLAEAQTVAATILQGGPESVRQTKRLLRELDPADFAQLLASATEFHHQGRLSDEAREGLAAFHQRRPPQWSGGIQ
jgi:methylglutaconyl-CoA hydratase